MKTNKKGFTLAELLIVVAIIGVLAGISIPIFTSQLEKSRDSVTISNLRAAYAQAQTAWLTGEGGTDVSVNSTASTVTVKNVIGKGDKDDFGETELNGLPGGNTVWTGVKSMGQGKGSKFDLTFTYTTDGLSTVAAAAAAGA